MDVRTLAITTAIGVGWGDILEVGGYLTSPSNTLGQFDGTYDPLGDALESLREQFPDLPVKMLENLLDDAAKAAKSTVPGPYMPEFSPWDFIGEEDFKDLYNQNLARTDPDGWGPPVGGNWHDELGTDAGYGSGLGDTGPSAKNFTNDPGGFGLGPGSQFGGNSNGFGSSSGGGGGGGGGPKNTGTSGNPQKDADLGGSVGSPTKTDPQGRPPSDPKYTGPQPILLDLDGNGVRVDELSRSTTFIDAGGDGLKRRTAWAGAGDGVLFFDADGDGALSERREYVFTEWDPTASSDMEALRSYLDTNGDGKLTAADAGFAQFRVLVTNADGTKTARTLAELGITEINLTEDATRIVLPDGSVIEGQTTFKKSDGSTGTVASTALVAEAEGHRVTEVVSTDGNGNRVVVSTAYGAGGQVLYAVTSVTSPTGASVTNSWDDDGDGVTDRTQTIDTVTNGDGSKTETIVNKVGAVAATAITVSRTVTTRSADGASVVIERDSTGGGWFDQREVQVIHADGSRTNTTSDLSQSGAVIRSVSETVPADGRTRATAANEDGLGGADTITTHAITVNGDLSRTEVVSVTNGDASLRARETTVVSADGKTRTITSDLDGDGDTDLTEAQEITVSGAGSASTITLTNGDGSLRSTETHTQSTDALTKTIARDVDGDGDNDTLTVDQTVVNADLSRVNTMTVTNVDGSVREKTMVTLGADKVTSETWVDLDQDGTFQATDLVKSVTVDAGTQLRTAQTWERNADGSVRASEVVTTSADGLDTTRVRDADGDGDADARIEDVTVLVAGVATRTVTVRNQDNSLRTKTETVTSADGLTVTSQTDIDGDGSYDARTIDARVLNGDGSTTRTVTDYAGNGTTLTGKATTEQSADRRTVTVTRDADGDGAIDDVTTSIDHYNNHRYHESIDNLTPADVYFGRGETILAERRRIKQLTIQNRRLNHQRQAA